MKNTLIIVLFILLSKHTFAEKRIIIEPAMMECQYAHTVIRDTLDRNKVMKDRMILRIGKKSANFIAGTAYKATLCGLTPEEERLPYTKL